MSSIITQLSGQNSQYLMTAEQISEFFSQLLGNEYVVKLNSLEKPDTTGKNIVTVHMQRIPFSIAEVNSETMSVTLNARCDISEERKKNKIINDFSKIIGLKTWAVSFEEDGLKKKYMITTSLEAQPPNGYPQIDTAQIVADYTVTGSILISSSGGAEMANYSKYYLHYGSDEDFSEEDRIAPLAVKASNQVSAESPLRLNGNYPDCLDLNQIVTISLVVVDLGGTADVKVKECIDGKHIGNAIFKLRKTTMNADGMSASNIYTLCFLGGETNENMGAFNQYTVYFQVLGVN